MTMNHFHAIYFIDFFLHISISLYTILLCLNGENSFPLFFTYLVIGERDLSLSVAFSRPFSLAF